MGLSREQFYTIIGLVKIIDPLTDAAYEAVEREIWEQNLDSAPHGEEWFTSFHASNFPGSNPSACGRAAVYGLLDLPDSAPTSRWLRGLADCGKNIERELVDRWHRYGILLSAPSDSAHQTGFVDPEHWLTGNTDAIILPHGWKRPHVVEVKTKAHEKILEMQALMRGPEEKHVRQAKTYIGFAHENPDLFPGLGECNSGSIYYVSRDDPSTTHEFTFAYDPVFMSEGRSHLADWRDTWIAGRIPGRPRDDVGKLITWGQEPCKYCPFKKAVCKVDWKNQTETLAESAAIEYAKQLRPSWDYDEVRKQVLERWSGNEN